MREVDELAIEPFARNLLHLEVGVREREAKQFAPGVAGRADDGNSEWWCQKRSLSGSGIRDPEYPSLCLICVNRWLFVLVALC